MTAYLKAETILYHPHLARDGRLFSGSAGVPVPHPGDGWVDSPAEFSSDAKTPTADEIVAAGALSAEVAANNERLIAEGKDLLKRAEAAEDGVAATKQMLLEERHAHADTKAELEAARAEVRRLDAAMQDHQVEAAKVPSLTVELAAVTEARDELQKALAKAETPKGGK